MGIRSGTAAQRLYGGAVDERLRGSDSGESRCIQESGAELHLSSQLSVALHKVIVNAESVLDAAPRVRISN